LSLFTGRSSESPQSLLKIPSFEYSRKFSQKTQEKKVKNSLKPLKTQKKTPNDQKLPELSYKNIRKLRDSKTFGRKLRDISKDFGKPTRLNERVRQNIRSFDSNQHLLSVLNNDHNPKKKKKSVCEILEEMKLLPKVRRISSSKITYPSANYGQILDRIKDLVIDPLKLELGDSI